MYTVESHMGSDTGTYNQTYLSFIFYEKVAEIYDEYSYCTISVNDQSGLQSLIHNYFMKISDIGRKTVWQGSNHH